jgi:hypothetical protein
MSVLTRMTVTRVFCAALGLSAPLSSQSGLAGSLNKCDEARIAARNTVLNKYGAVLLSLDNAIARASAAGLDPMKLPYGDADNGSQSVDVTGLKESLKNQQASDAGYADRKIATECGAASESIADLVKIADNIASHGISAVLPKSMANVDASDRGPSRTMESGMGVGVAQPLPPGQ